MFCLKSSLRTIPISQCHRQLSVTSAKTNRGPTTSEEQELKFARAKVRIRVLFIYSEVSDMALLLTHTNFSHPRLEILYNRSLSTKIRSHQTDFYNRTWQDFYQGRLNSLLDQTSRTLVTDVPQRFRCRVTRC